MRFKYIIFFSCFAFAKAELSQAQQPQTKQERETRIAINEFPAKAQEYVLELSNSRKSIKYYKETDGYLVSYEAKYRYNKTKYSVECKEDGTVEDVELLIKKRHINDDVIKRINSQLNKISNRNRIEKIQQQYIAHTPDVQSMINRIKNQDYDYYEMIVAFKDKRKIYRKELLFNKKGELVSQRDVKRLEYDFLLF